MKLSFSINISQVVPPQRPSPQPRRRALWAVVTRTPPRTTAQGAAGVVAITATITEVAEAEEEAIIVELEEITIDWPDLRPIKRRIIRSISKECFDF